MSYLDTSVQGQKVGWKTNQLLAQLEHNFKLGYEGNYADSSDCIQK